MKNKLILLFALLFTFGATAYSQKNVIDNNQLRLAAYKNALFSNDQDLSVSLCEQFLKDFPINKTNEKFDAENNLNYGKIYERIILTYNAKGEYKKWMQYISSMPYSALPNVHYRSVYVPYDKIKMISAEKLFPYENLIFKRLVSFKNNIPYEWKAKSISKWENQYNKLYYDCLLTHIKLLRELNKNSEGLAYAKDAINFYSYAKDASLNEDYAIFLQRAGKLKDMQYTLEMGMKHNQATKIMIEMLKKIYIKKNGKEEGFDEYAEALKDKTDSLNLREKIKAKIFKKEIESFSLYDSNGKLVTLSEQKGKIVVLDFWSSWCAPCKAALEGMQMAVNKYKNDPNVIFYFIDTQEIAANYKELVMKFIKEKHYESLHILFDNKTAGSKATDQVSKMYKIGAIPKKLFIDANGYLRFVSVGYNWSPSELVDEVSIVIELLKEEN